MPDTVNDQLLDRVIRHAVFLERYKASTVNKMLSVLAKADKALRAELAERMLAIDVRGFDTGPVTTQRIEQMIAAILAARGNNMTEISDALRAEMLGLAEYETPFMTAMIQTAIPAQVLAHVSLITPSPQQVYAAALARPFQGKLLGEVLTSLIDADATRIRDTIRIGFVTRRTTPQIIRDLLSSTGTLLGTRRNVEAITRTALQHTAMVARQQVGVENASVIKAVKFVATLDSRTTPICQALDGKTWPPDSEKIRWPPIHWQCRSTIVYVTKSWRELGIDMDETSEGTRRAMAGEVPKNLTYNGWLKQQSAALQDEILGQTRGRLFRKGDLPVDRFVNINTGREYTLDELRRRESVAWNATFSNTG